MEAYSTLQARQKNVLQCFPDAIGADEYVLKTEIALEACGFTAKTCLALINLCRDEACASLKAKLDVVLGSSFNVNGLGAVVTCGVTGMKAGLSHAPVCQETGRERYVFLSFPHIAISGAQVGVISRPGRNSSGLACGALQQVLRDFEFEGVLSNCCAPGLHDAIDPEYSILKHRIARFMRREGLSAAGQTLSSLTCIAERVITEDLEELIMRCVDLRMADYAVITGVNIHDWPISNGPRLEYVAPRTSYAVIQGERVELDLSALPAFAPRQLSILSEPWVQTRQLGLFYTPTPRFQNLSSTNEPMTSADRTAVAELSGDQALQEQVDVLLHEQAYNAAVLALVAARDGLDEASATSVVAAATAAVMMTVAAFGDLDELDLAQGLQASWPQQGQIGGGATEVVGETFHEEAATHMPVLPPTPPQHCARFTASGMKSHRMQQRAAKAARAAAALMTPASELIAVPAKDVCTACISNSSSGCTSHCGVLSAHALSSGEVSDGTMDSPDTKSSGPHVGLALHSNASV